MKVSQLTAIGWCANMMLDRREQSPFTFDDIYSAADRGCLIELLLKIDRRGIIELWAHDPKKRADMELVLANAVKVLRGQEIDTTGVGDNPLCMVIALVLEAIQQHFR